jgi:hypothetical protein
MDITFAQLASNAPADSVVASNGTAPLPAGVYINVGKLTEDTVPDLSSNGVVETVVKLLKACNKTQTALNAVTGATPINSFPQPSYGIPIAQDNGDVTSSVTCAVVGLMSFNHNNITANS